LTLFPYTTLFRSPAQRVFALVVLPFVDARGGKAELRRANRGDVSRRTGTDYHYIE
jgi:hypothetical protein